MAIYEMCVGNYNGAVLAQDLGADRVELCDNLFEGGTTPSYGTIKKTIENIRIPTVVIIRPRGGNFEFSDDEVEIMLDDITVCKELGAYGVVIGALKGKAMDLETTKRLVEEAKPMKVTFHMAFDDIEAEIDVNLEPEKEAEIKVGMSPDVDSKMKSKFTAIDKLVELGVERILTKGGMINAIEGKDALRELVNYADNRIIIMPGKGVTKANRDEILEYTGAKEIHGTKVVL